MTQNDTTQILTQNIDSTCFTTATTPGRGQVQTSQRDSKQKEGQITGNNTFAEFILQNLRLVIFFD